MSCGNVSWRPEDEANMRNDQQSTQPSPTVLALTRLMVWGAGLLCCVFLMIAILTGEATIFTKSGTRYFRWSTEPEYFLSALVFYTVVIAAAAWVAIDCVNAAKKAEPVR